MRVYICAARVDRTRSTGNLTSARIQFAVETKRVIKLWKPIQEPLG